MKMGKIKIIYLASFVLLLLIARRENIYAGKTTSFLPGGAWEQDKGIVIKEVFEEEKPDYKEPSEEMLSAEKAGLDPYFDPRDQGLVSEIKDQSGFALCWDFAAVSTAESALLRNGYDITIDLSEYHGAAAIYQRQKKAGIIPETESFADFCSAGGSPADILSLWQEGYGPVLEEDYLGIETISQNSVPEDIPAGRVWSLATIKNIEGSIDVIKQEIRQSGAVLGLYYSYGMYYNDLVNEKKDSSYYMPYTVKIRNHAISIVGWDDEFPADSFVNGFVNTKEGRKPLPNGAWLIKNSWGKRAYKSPDEASGYYWISYYDKSLSDFTAISLEEEKESEGYEESTESEDVINDDAPKDCNPDKEAPAEMQMSDICPIYDASGESERNNKIMETAEAKDGAVNKEKKRKAGNIRIKGIEYSIKAGRASVKNVKSKKRRIGIPASIKYRGKKYPVIKIGKRAFAGNRHVRSIILGKNIRSIGKEAFKGCKNLKSIRIGL